MRWQWCWRCQQEMPMLDEEEFARVARLYRDGFGGPRASADAAHPRPPRSIQERFAPVTLEYERMTGYADCPPAAVMHHRLSLFGPPCAACNKPLRTPQASLCAACGTSRTTHAS